VGSRIRQANPSSVGRRHLLEHAESRGTGAQPCATDPATTANAEG